MGVFTILFSEATYYLQKNVIVFYFFWSNIVN